MAPSILSIAEQSFAQSHPLPATGSTVPHPHLSKGASGSLLEKSFLTEETLEVNGHEALMYLDIYKVRGGLPSMFRVARVFARWVRDFGVADSIYARFCHPGQPFALGRKFGPVHTPSRSVSSAVWSFLGKQGGDLDTGASVYQTLTSVITVYPTFTYPFGHYKAYSR